MSCCSEYITIYDDKEKTQLLQIYTKAAAWDARTAPTIGNLSLATRNSVAIH